MINYLMIINAQRSHKWALFLSNDMTRTKCNKCFKQFLSYDPGDFCPACGGGKLREGWSGGPGGSAPKKAPSPDSKFFKQRCSTRCGGRAI